MTIGEREEDAARREAEHAVGNDRKKTPPVSDRPVEEPVEVPRPDLEDPARQE
ncbi:MAG TPA: hypothetical protein VFL83_13030 [Anaeromyxobacter sp.]|nr:hypothetical protein [Anaeromyxobacter sp.]